MTQELSPSTDGLTVDRVSPPPRHGIRSPKWLSWHWHQRTAAITQEWGIEWIMLDTHRHGLARYVELLARSVVALWGLRRSTVVVQSPSVLLGALTVAAGPLLRMRVAIDAHNEAIQPFAHDSRLIRWLIGFAVRHACTTIVTNEELADRVRDMGGRSFVLPDAIPTPPSHDVTPEKRSLPVVLIICTYAADEPVEVFVETARRLTGSAEVRLTGRPSSKALSLLEAGPANLKALGFLSEADYWAELRTADVVVDLTLKPYCLVCGAYEAIAVGKAPILSDDISGRRLFGSVASFVDNTADGLAEEILRRLHGRVAAADPIVEFREKYMSDWRSKLAMLGPSLACGVGPEASDGPRQ